MKATNIRIGKTYELAFGEKRTSPVKVTDFDPRNGSWIVETYSGKSILVKDAKRFLKEVRTKTGTPKTEVEPKTGRPDDKPAPAQKMSGLNAAFKVLAEEARSMNVKEITELAQMRNYCDLPGATPSATISSAIQRDIKAKGETSRFVKTGKGQFIAR